MNDAVLFTVEHGVGTITLNRPERLNAVNFAVTEGLLAAVRQAAEDATVGCVVVTGAGRGFCAGGDTKEGARPPEPVPARDQEQMRGARLRRVADASRLLREMPKPTIAMVNGPVAGAGIGIAGACDLRFGAQSATFVAAYARIGASGDYGASFVWPKILGAAKARELFLLDQTFTADAALAFGLYHRVFSDDALRDETILVAQKLAAGPRAAWAYLKANLNASEDMTFTRHLDQESLFMGLSTRVSAEQRKSNKDS